VKETGFSQDAVRAALADAVVVPVLRTDSAESALGPAQWAVEQGLPVVELTATTPGWRDALASLRERFPDVAVGVGTLVDERDANDACDLGAAFLVSPVPAPDVAAVAARRGRLMVGGGFTPAELLAAAAGGVAKLFPAHAVGPRFLRSVLAVAPGADVIPTGGIALADVPAWLEAGALCVGIGSELDPGPATARELRALRAILEEAPA
jgi:2-dehydro-3-deoxyphosphogluconate aldolase/(4S)-4-hydroxy-2-oxoglutarate aldolase